MLALGPTVPYFIMCTRLVRVQCQVSHTFWLHAIQFFDSPRQVLRSPPKTLGPGWEGCVIWTVLSTAWTSSLHRVSPNFPHIHLTTPRVHLWDFVFRTHRSPLERASTPAPTPHFPTKISISQHSRTLIPKNSTRLLTWSGASHGETYAMMHETERLSTSGYL